MRQSPTPEHVFQTEPFSDRDDPSSSSEDSDRVQIVERLAWTPKQRLDYLVDMIAFEERAHQARRLG